MIVQNHLLHLFHLLWIPTGAAGLSMLSRASVLTVGWFGRRIPIPARRRCDALPCSKNQIVEEQRGGEVNRFKPDIPKGRGQINNMDWRTDLLELARLLDHLAPDFHDPELFHVQKNALAAELRRLARWAAPRG